jgi:hypothetical protein
MTALSKAVARIRSAKRSRIEDLSPLAAVLFIVSCGQATAQQYHSHCFKLQEARQRAWDIAAPCGRPSTTPFVWVATRNGVESNATLVRIKLEPE